MVLVRVYRVSSVMDPETGRYGKLIELVEEKRIRTQPLKVSGAPQESIFIQSMIQDLTNYLQSLGFSPLGAALKPKMTFFLTEEEYEMLGVKLDVNEVYELEFREGKISFKRAYD
ncbi:MAG: arcadin 1 [Nitrososphaeria archaeon]|nr:arcadin 1 [Nitrososphaeria archaeon]MDW8021177.1 arcadin 1 [Nitrososphaerota archaeon]